MSELSNIPKEIIPEKTNILVVCMNGQSRSKVVAQVLNKMGYANTMTMGIKDPFLKREQKITNLKSSHLVIATAKDVLAEIKALYPTTNITLIEIAEKDHASMHAKLSVIPAELQSKIVKKLELAGFISP